jgi:hypothetical protein
VVHLGATSGVLAAATVATAGGPRAYQHLDCPDVFAIAKPMAAAFPPSHCLDVT